jgi:protein SCO1/2
MIDVERTDNGPPVASVPAARAGRVLERPWFWLVVIALVFLVPLARTFARGAPPPLPTLWIMPEWRLTDQRGRLFGSAELRGRVYVANFIFTTCTWSCPRLTSRMAVLQSRVRHLGPAVHLVSVSVDPTNDTPARLLAYATRYHADESRWTFVTGPEDTVLRAVSDGFRVGVVMPRRGPAGEFNPVELAHSNRFALVDARGRMRGAYDVDDEGLARLVRDVARLAAER